MEKMVQFSEYMDTRQIKVRSSNIELYRIICMFFIVAHHYVVNSGLLDIMSNDQTSTLRFFYYCISAWGKTAINCFILITGYYMCKSDISLKKLLKLLFEIYFYCISITLIFLITGYAQPTINVIIYALVPLNGFMHSFIVGYLFLFCCIPFLNILIRNLNQKKHLRLVVFLILSFSVIGSIPKLGGNVDYVAWFPTLYLLAAYVRLYGSTIRIRYTYWGGLFLLSVLISILSICFLVKYANPRIYDFFLNDSNKIMAIIVAFTSFMFVKDYRLRHSRILNTVASSVFGVLLIHANSDTMRHWLWKDVLHVTDKYGTDGQILYFFLSCIGIYVICTCVDQLRILLVEKPVLRLISR